MSLADFVRVGQPAKAHAVQALAFGRLAKCVGRRGAVTFPESVAACGQRHRFLVVHRHTQERLFHIARHAFGVVRVAAWTFGVDIDQAHLDCRQWIFQRLPFVGIDARWHPFVHPLLLRSPIDIGLGLIDILATAAEAEHRSAHRFDGDITGQDEQIGPADMLAIFLLDRPEQATRLVEIAVVGPAVERSEALLPARSTAATVAGPVGACCMPCHADEEGTIMSVISRPPRLAVGHQRFQIFFQRLIVERLEGLGIVKVGPHRVWRNAALSQNIELQLVRPPVAIGTAKQRTYLAVEAHWATFGGTGCFHVHLNISYMVQNFLISHL